MVFVLDWLHFWWFYTSEFDEFIFVGLVFEAVWHVGSPGGRGREERPGWIFYTLQSCHTMDTKPYHAKAEHTLPHFGTLLYNIAIPYYATYSSSK